MEPTILNKKIVMLTRQGEPLMYLYNGLKDKFEISDVIIEKSTNRKDFLKRRIKRLGYIKVFGQALFQVVICRIIRKKSTERIAQIKSIYNLDNSSIPESIVKRVSSVNSDGCIDYLKAMKPDLIIVNGTRIISKKVLNTINATFVNTHGGITPKYRGIYGGYWAIANRDKENFGVTVHLIDSGIDTGGVLYQKSIETTPKDNVTTYTYLQKGVGIQLMEKTIIDFIAGKLTEIEPQTTESHLWSTPTLWHYLYRRIRYGAK